MADFTKFRTSIGGFNRDDVVHYIETASVEHLKELRQVKNANEAGSLKRPRCELDETKKKLTAANAKKLDRMTVEDASLQQQVETLAQEAAELAQRATPRCRPGGGGKSQAAAEAARRCRGRRVCESQRTSRTTRKHRRKCPLCPLRRGIIRKRSWKPTAGRSHGPATRSCAAPAS